MSHSNTFKVLHPTDLSTSSLPAFAHGLLISTKAKGRFTVLHVEGDEAQHWSELPGVRSMLHQWGMIMHEEDEEGLKELGLGVKKVIAKGDDPAPSTIEYLDRHPMDLVVLGTHQDKGWRRWQREQVAEPIARASNTTSLFIPAKARGLVDTDTGEVKLRKVLIPVASVPNATFAVEAVRIIATLLECDSLDVTLLHVGDEGSCPIVNATFSEQWDVQHGTVQGDVVDNIIDRAEAMEVDLIAMTTKGHDGFLDMLRGSTTEQVLRRSPAALLAIPEGSGA